MNEFLNMDLFCVSPFYSCRFRVLAYAGCRFDFAVLDVFSILTFIWLAAFCI